VAPAMDEDMWNHPNTKKNLDLLRQNANTILDVSYGELASGLIGDGRMSEPEEIVQAINKFFENVNQLKGKKALVTAGPTYEAIDPVRFIGNHSTGKMGYAIAEELASRGAEVTLISGPVSITSKNKGIKMLYVSDANEMYTTCLSNSPSHDMVIMAAAVADYTPTTISDQKIKKKDGEMVITLKKTKDILASLGSLKSDGQILVGFALETEDEIINAKKKLSEKNADLIILNSLNDEGAGFGHDTNKVTLFFRTGKEKQIELKSKSALAKDIVDAIIEIK